MNLREGIAQNITPVIKINVFILKIWSGRVLIYSTGDIRSIIVGLSSLLALPALFLIFETLIFVNLYILSKIFIFKLQLGFSLLQLSNVLVIMELLELNGVDSSFQEF